MPWQGVPRAVLQTQSAEHSLLCDCRRHPLRNEIWFTSLVLVSRNLARVLFASPNIFCVPTKLVLMVLMGLYLHQGKV